MYGTYIYTDTHTMLLCERIFIQILCKIFSIVFLYFFSVNVADSSCQSRQEHTVQRLKKIRKIHDNKSVRTTGVKHKVYFVFYAQLTSYMLQVIQKILRECKQFLSTPNHPPIFNMQRIDVGGYTILYAFQLLDIITYNIFIEIEYVYLFSISILYKAFS